MSRVDARLSLLMSAAVNAFPFLGMTLSDVAVRMDESCKDVWAWGKIVRPALAASGVLEAGPGPANGPIAAAVEEEGEDENDAEEPNGMALD